MVTIDQKAGEALKTFAARPETVATRELSRHNKQFSPKKLGARHLLGSAMTVEPAGLEFASGHFLCQQKHTRWYFLQDFQSRTLLGRGVDKISNNGHRIGIKFDRDLMEQMRHCDVGQRVATIASKLNWNMTAAAVVFQKKWQDAIGSLPESVAPMDIQYLQLPVLMTTALVAPTDNDKRQLVADLAAADVTDLYRAFRFGRKYYTPFDGVISLSEVDGCTIIEVTPVEQISAPLRYQVLLAISSIHVEHGATVTAGQELFTMFPRDEWSVGGKYANCQAARTAELDSHFPGMVDAINSLYFANEIFNYSNDGHMAVPYDSARLLSSSKLAAYAVTKEQLLDSLVYDLSGVANTADDDTFSYLFTPLKTTALLGQRWLGRMMIDVEVEV